MTRNTPRKIRSIPKLPPRQADAYKGAFGHVLIVGGSRGMIGAPSLSANAALKSGAGLVTVACPTSIQLAVAGLCPCAITIPIPENRAGILNPVGTTQELATLRLFDEIGTPSVVAGGPGMGRGDGSFEQGLTRLWNAFAYAGVPLVLDADALNAPQKSGRKEGKWNQSGWSRLVVTPHPGELARMMGVTTKQIQQDRIGWATKAANEMATSTMNDVQRPVVVLKGAGTIVTESERVYVNKTGNPGMATGGAGDVLTGIIAALIAQGMTCFDGAVLGVYVHGLAGDLAAKDLGQVSLTAADLIGYLPKAFRH